MYSVVSEIIKNREIKNLWVKVFDDKNEAEQYALQERGIVGKFVEDQAAIINSEHVYSFDVKKMISKHKTRFGYRISIDVASIDGFVEIIEC